MITHTRLVFRQIKAIIAKKAAANISSTYGLCDKSIICTSGSIRVSPLAVPTTANAIQLFAGESFDILADGVFIGTTTSGMFQAVIWE